jgi:hypothetical protein
MRREDRRKRVLKDVTNEQVELMEKAQVSKTARPGAPGSIADVNPISSALERRPAAKTGMNRLGLGLGKVKCVRIKENSSTTTKSETRSLTRSEGTIR